MTALQRGDLHASLVEHDGPEDRLQGKTMERAIDLRS